MNHYTLLRASVEAALDNLDELPRAIVSAYTVQLLVDAYDDKKIGGRRRAIFAAMIRKLRYNVAFRRAAKKLVKRYKKILQIDSVAREIYTRNERKYPKVVIRRPTKDRRGTSYVLWREKVKQ